MDYWETITLHCKQSGGGNAGPLRERGLVEERGGGGGGAQLAALGGPSGMSDMKKVMMKDQVEDRKPA